MALTRKDAEKIGWVFGPEPSPAEPNGPNQTGIQSDVRWFADKRADTGALVEQRGGSPKELLDAIAFWEASQNTVEAGE